MRATIIAAIITSPRHRLAILIVARFPSRLSRYSGGRPSHYVRDDQPFAGPAPPAAVYYASGDRRGAHPQKHLATFTGI
ncbi:hypothetical protein [Bradyrhizobium sp. 150]|uniref:hypothetical protein n=1 Tax=Bradyrhizobium sp. 150 TaxID=2782625 RepID=UPI001FFA464F|nr:hypothetical protein [Bradyrhizobium sp. 150]MCK1672068.1 hypothetical protein [Bradyrhizobium sp. 150]